MGELAWTWTLVVASFALYALVAAYARARAVKRYYMADRPVSPVFAGVATASDWISAASFLSVAGLIAFGGRDGAAYLVGFTGGYVLLAVLLAPLRRYGKYTVPQFVGERFYSRQVRVLALVCAALVSFVYLTAQVRGVGLVLARFTGSSIGTGVRLAMVAVFVYALADGVRGSTSARVAQFAVVTVAYVLPAVLLSLLLTGHAVPAVGLGAPLSSGGAVLLGAAPGERVVEVVDRLGAGLGFLPFATGWRPRLDVLATVLTLVAGTAGLPHILIRFFTVPRIREARASVAWALLFVAIFYSVTPALGAFGRATLVAAVQDQRHDRAPAWLAAWESTGLVAWEDRNGDGRMQLSGSPAANEVRVDRDVLVLALPEMAGLPPWVVGLVAAGALAAALSTAAGLLLIIGSAIAHDLGKSHYTPNLSERNELRLARIAAASAVLLAGALALHPPGAIAEVVALAFGLAASTLFPALVLGIFWRRATRQGATAGMAAGLALTLGCIAWFKLLRPELDVPAGWWLGISPEGMGAVGMLLAFAVGAGVSLATPAPPVEAQALVDRLRSAGTGEARR